MLQQQPIPVHPRGNTAPDMATHSAAGTAELARKQFTVLLVEDDTCTRTLVASLLGKCNYKVHVACNGREALDVLRRTDCPIDLILTDILMPEVSGMHLMAELAANEALRSIPVIVMSSDERQDTVMRAIEAGATDYLIKPVRRNELATLWQHVWRRHRTPTTTATAPAQPPATSTAMESTAFATSYQHAKHLTNSPQQSASGTADWPTTHFVSSGSRLAVPGGATWSDAAAAESVRARGMMDDPAHLAEAASPQDPRGSDESGGGGGSTSQDATRLESGALGGDGPAATTPTNVRQPLQPCRAEPGTPASLPQGLRELVEFAERQDHLQHTKRAHHVEDSGDSSSFHHSTTSSAFTSFATFVPRPCTRGDARAAQRAQACVVELPGLQSGEQEEQGEEDPVVQQTKQFVMAFQQAVDEHQRRVMEWARNRKAAIHRFREKRKARTFDKKVRYESRKRLAESRPRIKGQFVKAEVAAKYYKDHEDGHVTD